MNPDTITAICAVLIALLSLVFAVWQGLGARKHNRLSLRPSLRPEFLWHDGQPPQVDLVNAGVGPAEIRQFAVHLDGSAVSEGPAGGLVAALNGCGLPGGRFWAYTLVQDQFFAAGERQTLLKILDLDSAVNETRIRESLNRIKFLIGYESLYGEPFNVQEPACPDAALADPA